MKISLRECLLITFLCAVPLGAARLEIGAGMLLTFLPFAYCVWRFCALSGLVTIPRSRVLVAGSAGALGTLAVMAVQLEYWKVQLGLFSAVAFLGGLLVGCMNELFLYARDKNKASALHDDDAAS